MNSRLIGAVLRQAETLGHEPRPAPTDADLLRRVVSRDTPEDADAAFAELVRRHGTAVWAACRHLLPDLTDAEDAFQVTFLALARSGDTIRSGGAAAGGGTGSRSRGKSNRVRFEPNRVFRERRAVAISRMIRDRVEVCL